MPEILIDGLCASAGLARGELVEYKGSAAVEVRREVRGTPDDEAAVLRAAIELAAQQLGELMSDGADEADKASAEIIEFQIAFVLDDELSAPAFAAIARGEPAPAAWNAALADEIAGYEASDDEYFRARATDLHDLRQRVLICMTGAEAGHADRAYPPGGILFAADLAPSAFLSMDWREGGAVVLAGGSPNSHLAMLARSRGVPMIVGARWSTPLPAGAQALVDGRLGRAIVAPKAPTAAEFAARLDAQRAQAKAAQKMACRPAQSSDGQRIQLNINIASADELATIDPASCDGVGLFRTEFLYSDKAGFPDEETQYRIYRRTLDWAAGRPVVIRTLDAGADKPVPGLTPVAESNPFLGVRGIRLSLARPEVLRVQLRALLRAAAHGALRILLPMVSLPAEIAAVRELLADELARLRQQGVAAACPPLGIMIEVPATAIAIDLYSADFYSIGSNDLTQYVMAAARDNLTLAELLDPAHEAMLRLIGNVVRHGQHSGRDVSLCGEAASDPLVMPLLLRRGLRSLSVAPASIGRVKMDIAKLVLPSAFPDE